MPAIDTGKFYNTYVFGGKLVYANLRKNNETFGQSMPRVLPKKYVELNSRSKLVVDDPTQKIHLVLKTSNKCLTPSCSLSYVSPQMVVIPQWSLGNEVFRHIPVFVFMTILFCLACLRGFLFYVSGSEDSESRRARAVTVVGTATPASLAAATPGRLVPDTPSPRSTISTASTPHVSC